MTEEAREALLPCPFCGNRARSFQHQNENAFVACSMCNARNGVNYPSIAAAEKAWNTRQQAHLDAGRGIAEAMPAEQLHELIYSNIPLEIPGAQADKIAKDICQAIRNFPQPPRTGEGE